MAIIVQSQPETYGLAYNDNIYVIRHSVPTPTIRLKVIVSTLWTAAAPPETIATLVVYPTPATTGTTDRSFFDVSRVVQSQLNTTFRLVNTANLSFYYGGGGIFGYKVTLVEQDVDANGNYVDGSSTQLAPKFVWDGGIDMRDWLDFDIDTYLMDTGVGNHSFLTEGPTGTDYRDIGTDESACLCFISEENNAPLGYYLTTYSDFDAGGTQLSNAFVTNYNAGSISSGTSEKYGRVYVGTSNIPNILASQMSGGTPSTILNGVKSYSIRMWDASLPISEVVTFNIGKKCSKYTPVRLHWLNRLGGFDSFNFNLLSEQNTKVDKKDYYKQPRTFNGTTWAYAKDSSGATRYDTQTSKSLTINTDYITDVESTWMESLFTSPMVFQEVNGELAAVTVDGRSITEQKSLNNKLNQYRFDINYSLTNTRQRG